MSQIGSKKSRKGCRRCKQRRVKCDEQTPCSNCVRRNEECSLLEPTPSGSSDTSTDAGHSRGEEWIQDLELMHHYSKSAARGQFGERETLISLWSDYIPQQALKHVFLMHGLLAIAALHLAYEQPEAQTRYLRLCDKHQSVALKTFREVLSSDVNKELADALFALSAVISVSSIARSCVMNDERVIEPAAVAELFFLTRGVRDVIHLHYEHIKQGPMVGIFENQEYPPGTEVILPSLVSNHFEAIRQMLISYGLDPEALGHCQEALRELEEIYKNIMYFGPMTTLETGQVFRWKVHVHTGYVRLIQARNPPALVILAYYAAAVTPIRTAWYLRNFAEYVLRGISLELDESMQHWIQWPQQQLLERMAILGINPSEGESQSPKPLIGF